MEMNENQETKILGNTVSWMLTLLKACPQVVKKGIGAEEFVNELNNSGLEFEKNPPEVYGAIQSFLPFISACPQIFNPEIGIKAFLEELSKAAVKYEMIIKK